MISWTDLLTEIHQPYRQGDNFCAENSAPEVVVWNITSSCNLYCRHCYFNARQTEDSQELSHQEAENFIQDLADLGAKTLLFSGGEPLLKKDIFALAQFAKDKSIRTALSTNGTLITQNVANEIKKSGFFYVGISLDGAKKINDWFREKTGAFNQALMGIRNCQRAGLKVGLRFTLTRYNFRDLPYIFDLVEKEKIARLCLYHLVYAGRGSNLKNQDLTFAEKRKTLGFIWKKVLDFKQRQLNIEVLTVDNHSDGVWIYLRLKKIDSKEAKQVLRILRDQGGNSSGIRIACVDNYGNMYPDQFWRTHHLGNLRQKKFSDIWQDKENKFLLALRNRRPLLKGRCSRCKHMAICNGNFRVRSEAVFGDLWQEDPACYLTEREISDN